MYGLQRLCFGQLRPIEVEQLYEKAWFAITETALAMTIFREEVGRFIKHYLHERFLDCCYVFESHMLISL